jgi:hypothetical protein
VAWLKDPAMESSPSMIMAKLIQFTNSQCTFLDSNTINKIYFIWF